MHVAGVLALMFCTRSPHQLLDRELLDCVGAADLCVRTWHPLCLLAREIRKCVGAHHWT